jgi:predicted phosphohydrolase
MKIFAVSDLHLSLLEPYSADNQRPALKKPMEVFGLQWHDCFGRLDANWRAIVAEEDAVLLAGDLSWAMTLAEAEFDLAYLASLPGRKIIIKGNHDYWWSSLRKVRQAAPPSLEFLQHSALAVAGHAVCGTRGWLHPQHADFSEQADRAIYEREKLRLRMALEEAQKLDLPIIAMLHYPPLLKAEESDLSLLLSEYAVQTCVYGHVHGEKAPAFSGPFQGVDYINVSMDRLGFMPALLYQEQ